MSALLDILVVVIIILTITLGYKRGLIKTIAGFAVFFASFMASWIFSPYLKSFVYEKAVNPFFTANILNKFSEILGNISESIDMNKLITDKPNEFVDFITNYGFDVESVADMVNEAAEHGTEQANHIVAEQIAEPLAQSTSYFIAFVLIFIISFILCRILIKVLDAIFGLPVLKIINKTGGLVCGCAAALSYCAIFVIASSYILPYLSSSMTLQPVSEIIDSSFVYRWFYENNPLGVIVAVNRF